MTDRENSSGWRGGRSWRATLAGVASAIARACCGPGSIVVAPRAQHGGDGPHCRTIGRRHCQLRLCHEAGPFVFLNGHEGYDFEPASFRRSQALPVFRLWQARLPAGSRFHFRAHGPNPEIVRNHFSHASARPILHRCGRGARYHLARFAALGRYVAQHVDHHRSMLRAKSTITTSMVAVCQATMGSAADLSGRCPCVATSGYRARGGGKRLHLCGEPVPKKRT